MGHAAARRKEPKLPRATRGICIHEFSLIPGVIPIPSIFVELRLSDMIVTSLANNRDISKYLSFGGAMLPHHFWLLCKLSAHLGSFELSHCCANLFLSGCCKELEI